MTSSSSAASFRKLDSLAREIDDLSFKPALSDMYDSGERGRVPYLMPAASSVSSPRMSERRPPLALTLASADLYTAQDENMEKLETRVITQVESLVHRQRKLERFIQDQVHGQQSILRKQDAEVMLIKRGAAGAHQDMRDQVNAVKSTIDSHQQQYARLKGRVVKLEGKVIKASQHSDETALIARVDNQVKNAVTSVLTAVNELGPRIRQLETSVQEQEENSIVASLEQRLRAMQHEQKQLPQKLHVKWKHRLQQLDGKIKANNERRQRQMEGLMRSTEDLADRCGVIDTNFQAKIDALEREMVELKRTSTMSAQAISEHHSSNTEATLQQAFSHQLAIVKAETKSWRDEINHARKLAETESREADMFRRDGLQQLQTRIDDGLADMEQRWQSTRLQEEERHRREIAELKTSQRRMMQSIRDDNDGRSERDDDQLEANVMAKVHNALAEMRSRVDATTSALQQEQQSRRQLEQQLHDMADRNKRLEKQVSRHENEERVSPEKTRSLVADEAQHIDRAVSKKVEKSMIRFANVVEEQQNALRQDIVQVQQVIDQTRRDNIATFEQLAKRERQARAHSEQAFSARASVLEQQVFATLDKVQNQHRAAEETRTRELKAQRSREWERLEADRVTQQQQLDEFLSSAAELRRHAEENEDLKRTSSEERMEARFNEIELHLQDVIASVNERQEDLRTAQTAMSKRVTTALHNADNSHRSDVGREQLLEWKRDADHERERMSTSLKMSVEELRSMVLRQEQSLREMSETQRETQRSVGASSADETARVLQEVTQLRQDFEELQRGAMTHFESGVRQAMDETAALRTLLKQRVIDLRESDKRLATELQESVQAVTHSLRDDMERRASVMKQQVVSELGLALQRDASKHSQARQELRASLLTEINGAAAAAERVMSRMTSDEAANAALHEAGAVKQESRLAEFVASQERQQAERERRLADTVAEAERRQAAAMADQEMKQLEREQAFAAKMLQQTEAWETARAVEIAANPVNERLAQQDEQLRAFSARIDQCFDMADSLSGGEEQRKREMASIKQAREVERQEQAAAWERERATQQAQEQERLAAAARAHEERMAVWKSEERARQQEREKEDRQRAEQQRAWELERKQEMDAWTPKLNKMREAQEERIAAMMREFAQQDEQRKRDREAERQAMKREIEEQRTAAQKDRVEQQKLEAARIEKSREADLKRIQQWTQAEEARQVEMVNLEKRRQEENKKRELEWKKQQELEIEKQERRVTELRQKQEELMEQRRAEERALKEERQAEDAAREKAMASKMQQWVAEKKEIHAQVSDLSSTLTALKASVKKDVSAHMASMQDKLNDLQSTVDVLFQDADELKANNSKLQDMEERIEEVNELIANIAESIEREEGDLDRCVAEIKTLKGTIKSFAVEEEERVNDLIEKTREDIEVKNEAMAEAIERTFIQDLKSLKLNVETVTRQQESIDKHISGKFTKFEMAVAKVQRQSETWESKSVTLSMTSQKLERRLKELEGR